MYIYIYIYPNLYIQNTLYQVNKIMKRKTLQTCSVKLRNDRDGDNSFFTWFT